MSFASASFVAFLAVFLLGTLLLRGRPLVLFSTIGAYVFYSSAYAPYTILLFTSTLVDYLVGRAMEGEQRAARRRLLMAASLTTNLGLLAIFKYAGFVVATLNVALVELVGVQLPEPHLLLPIGISFYSFQALSYTIDVYRRQIPAERSFLSFAFYVSFFPHLIAGPIVRARDFLPQIQTHRPFRRDDTIRGIELVLVGLFKKLVVADHCAAFVEPVFAHPQQFGGGAQWLAALFFAVQIYGDFSGYTDVARGLARILGFYIKPNFRWPYLAGSMSEFWRRWHMSLSSWLRDYLYVSLGGSRVSSRLKLVRNIALTWFLSGLWHGAAWHFVLWGLYQGSVITAERLAGQTRAGRLWSAAPTVLRAPVFFAIVVLGWVLFRADTLTQATDMWWTMAGTGPAFGEGMTLFGTWPLVLVAIAAAAHVGTYLLRYDIDERSLLLRVPYPMRLILIVLTITAAVVFGATPREFIYFAF